jgi:hypothetical protein
MRPMEDKGKQKKRDEPALFCDRIICFIPQRQKDKPMKYKYKYLLNLLHGF